MGNKLLQPIDILVAPLVLLVIILLGALIVQRDRKALGAKFVQFFWIALAARLLASITRILITDYIVPSWGVDTKTYVLFAGRMVEHFFVDPTTTLEIILTSYDDYSVAAQQLTGHYFWENLRTSIIIRIGFFLYAITAGSYLGISFLCTFLAFIGSWLLYKTFYQVYPQYGKIMAIACLFLPTVVFYSTNLFKDPFCILGLGLACYYSFQIHRFGSSIVGWSMLLFGMVILGLIKAYILFAFLLAFGVYWFAALDVPLRAGIMKKFAKTAIIVLGLLLLIGGVVGFLNLGLDRYNPASIALRLEYLISGNRGDETGSGYALPVISLTPAGFFYFLFSAFNVSLFRPYPWEVNGVGPLILFFESFPTLIVTTLLLLRTAVINFFVQIFRDPVLLFCFTFAFIFLTITGAFSPTFGALCRYKIPGFPLFVIVLGVVAARYYEAEKRQQSNRARINTNPT
ncbi:hypothetical protein [Lewinella sp. 4G2]|uniref:hypothetical protein n=1 Tax=Lewinella sp. 4G2 TaxID=1803372 RepID=UPI0007B463EB|nr:hypothetical protein [Lewinella sp. 4G2]OAV44307.1 hypothetical protein A3850_007285 [Lewinella sp. 4G2]